MAEAGLSGRSRVRCGWQTEKGHCAPLQRSWGRGQGGQEESRAILNNYSQTWRVRRGGAEQKLEGQGWAEHMCLLLILALILSILTYLSTRPFCWALSHPLPHTVTHPIHTSPAPQPSRYSRNFAHPPSHTTTCPGGTVTLSS